MTAMLESLATIRDLLLVVLGFGLIVFVHELGHFIAARWAGIRVLAFAIGFGPAAASYRKGLGLRRGSSEPEYLAMRTGEVTGIQRTNVHKISPTEYRLNWLPFGGYVKMLGQEDLHPDAVSTESDSYQRCPVWKRMIVISAGVVMNVIFAGLLFVVVFMVGLPTEPAIVGYVEPGKPAARAVALNADELGITDPGLKPRDRLLLLNGEEPDSFNDLSLATAMGSPGEAVDVSVQREGYDRPLRFMIEPAVSPLSGLLEIGVEPARSAAVPSAKNDRQRELYRKNLAALGLPGIEPGMKLVAINDHPHVHGAEELDAAARASGGAPMKLTFAGADGTTDLSVEPRPEFQSDQFIRENGDIAIHQHLLGLTPVLTVASMPDDAPNHGLKIGDVFLQIGAVEYPSITQGIGEIRAAAGRKLDVVVARPEEDGTWGTVSLSVEVNRLGQIGFGAGDTSDKDTLLALPPRKLTALENGAEPRTPAAVSLVARPGTRIISVGGAPVSNFSDIRRELMKATRQAVESRAVVARVALGIELPVRGFATGDGPIESVEWEIPFEEAAALQRLGWVSPVSTAAFKLEEAVLKAGTPGEALRKGIAETKRVMITTYLTFPRLFQGTVKVEHLKGPVGIAHLGTQITSRGFVWLLFFMALISVNLAVINFLPLPIVDGGQFIFLALEGIRGRPVSVEIQNAATLAGMLLIGSVFLVVTFNDIAGLFGR